MNPEEDTEKERMMLEYYHSKPSQSASLNYTVDEPADAKTSESIDNFMGAGTSILGTKLNVISRELQERLRIRTHNIYRLNEDECKTTSKLAQLYSVGTYLADSHKEAGELEQRTFDIQRERRMQDTDCWRDLVMLTRDMLYASANRVIVP